MAFSTHLTCSEVNTVVFACTIDYFVTLRNALYFYVLNITTYTYIKTYKNECNE